MPLLHQTSEGLASTGFQTRESDVTDKTSADETFEELFLNYYGRIVAALWRLLGDRSQAEELTNEAFLKLYRKPLAEVSYGNTPGWLYRTAMNLGIDALRAAARRKKYEQVAAVDAARCQQSEDAYKQVLRAQRQQRVRNVLADLNPSHAQVLVLRAGGHSYKEVAAALGVSRGSVGTMLIRAEAAFEKRYRELYGDEEGL